jgi:hypothetical protein
MSAENITVIWATDSGSEHTMGQIITVEGEFHFLPDANTRPAFNATALRNLAAKLESLEQGNN